MIYKIVVRSPTVVPEDLELIHDNALSAKVVSEYIRKQFGAVDLAILRDDVELTADELAVDIRSYEIRSTMEEATRLPPTYRKARGDERDVAIGPDGRTAGVWRPPNPEDEHD